MEKKIENYQFGSYDGLKCKPWMNLNTCYASDNYTCRIVAQKEKKERVIDTTTVNLSWWNGKKRADVENKRLYRGKEEPKGGWGGVGGGGW